MAFKNIVDLHTHTDNSFDGNHSTMFLAETAYMKGIRAVAFTDHLEMDAFYKGNFDKTAIQSFFEVAKARSAFSGKLLVGVVDDEQNHSDHSQDGGQTGDCGTDVQRTPVTSVPTV